MSRRFRRWISWRWWALAALACVLLGRAALWGRGVAQQPLPWAGPCEVLQVVSGETLVVHHVGETASEPLRVRLLGVSVPSPQTDQATAFVRQQIADGGISLTLDKRRIDSHGTALAYVYVRGRLLNAALVRQGLAKVAPYPGDSATIGRELFRAQDLAHAEGLGLWVEGGKPNSSAAFAEQPVEE